MMLQEKAEQSKKLPWTRSRIKGRQDHQTQSETRNHQRDKNQLKDQDRRIGEQIQAGDQTVDLTHQEEHMGSI